MYIIEMHERNRAFARIILEKSDSAKTYEEFANYRIITNHAGDIDELTCKYCKKKRKVIAL